MGGLGEGEKLCRPGNPLLNVHNAQYISQA